MSASRRLFKPSVREGKENDLGRSEKSLDKDTTSGVWLNPKPRQAALKRSVGFEKDKAVENVSNNDRKRKKCIQIHFFVNIYIF